MKAKAGKEAKPIKKAVKTKENPFYGLTPEQMIKQAFTAGKPPKKKG